KIAPALSGAQTSVALNALKQAQAAATDEPTRTAAGNALKQIQARAQCVTSWQVAGPFRQAGKDYAALFDVPFPPENAEGQTTGWRALPAGTDPTHPWVMDLLKALGGEQCVAYARTWIHSDREQRARLELGSDDSIKVWLNRQLVHANNTA